MRPDEAQLWRGLLLPTLKTVHDPCGKGLTSVNHTLSIIFRALSVLNLLIGGDEGSAVVQVIKPIGAIDMMLYAMVPFAQYVWSIFLLALALYGAAYAAAELINTQVYLCTSNCATVLASNARFSDCHLLDPHIEIADACYQLEGGALCSHILPLSFCSH